MAERNGHGVTPEEFGKELAELLRAYQEQKYSFQVKLKDIDFDVDQDKVEALEIPFPFQDIDQAEHALQAGVITPNIFFEEDDTQHKVVLFDPESVGFSGFMNCVTHSLAITDHGLFEVGRYKAMNISSQTREWQWFLHRQLADAKEVTAWRESDITPTQILDICFEVMLGRKRLK